MVFYTTARRALPSLLLALAFSLAALVSDALAADENHFYGGYCTWYANEQAHQTWGLWVPWFGDAGDWGSAAAASGWAVSPKPRPNSILAMPRGVQGSGPDGHVGWVTAVDPDGMAVTVQSMNWSGFGVVSQQHIAVDGSVLFITPHDDPIKPGTFNNVWPSDHGPLINPPLTR